MRRWDRPGRSEPTSCPMHSPPRPGFPAGSGPELAAKPVSRTCRRRARRRRRVESRVRFTNGCVEHVRDASSREIEHSYRARPRATEPSSRTEEVTEPCADLGECGVVDPANTIGKSFATDGPGLFCHREGRPEVVNAPQSHMVRPASVDSGDRHDDGERRHHVEIALRRHHDHGTPP